MSLSSKTRLLFSVPRAGALAKSVVFTFLTIILGFASYQAAEVWSRFPYYLVMSALIGAHGYLCLQTTNLNILYIFRYFLVWILVFGTACVWWLYDGSVYVAPFGIEYQTNENTRTLVFSGLLSLCGSLLGWLAAFARISRVKQTEFVITQDYSRKLRIVGLGIATIFAMLYVWKAGGIISADNTYSSGQEGFSLEFGVFNLFHFTGIGLVLIGNAGKSKAYPQYILIAILTLIPGMLAGSRADFLPQAFLLFILLFNQKIEKSIVNQRYFHVVCQALIAFGLLIAAYLVATFIAIWRSGIDVRTAFEMILVGDAGRIINSIYGHRMLYLETGNMMLGGLYSAIVQVREGHTGLLWGQSYLNYLLITPPAFLGLPRPLGLEWATAINGSVMTQGGIFEVAEAYWNFGLIGCFVISFFWSYVFGWLLRRGLTTSNYFFLTWYIVFGLHGFRAIWYQNFGYFRLMTVMLVIYVFGLLFSKWYVANRRLVASSSSQLLTR